MLTFHMNKLLDLIFDMWTFQNIDNVSGITGVPEGIKFLD